MSQTPPPPLDEALGQADQVPNVKTTPKEGLLHALFAIHQGGPVDKAIGEAHARRQAEAELHQRNMNTIAAKLHYDEKMSKDPSATTTVMEGGVKPGSGYTPLTEDEKTKLRHQYDIAEQLFNKAAGVDKGTKAHAGAISTVLRHIVHRGAQQPKQSGGPTPPPSDGGGTPQQDTPLAGSSKPTPPPSGPSDAAMLPFERADIKDQVDYASWKRREELLHQYKLEEIKEQGAAKRANASGNPPRPINKRVVSVLDAKSLRDNMDSEFLGVDGKPLDLDNIPESMSLEPSWVAFTNPQTNQREWKVIYTPSSPNQKIVGRDNEQTAYNPADVSKPGAGTVVGTKNVPTTTVTHDPVAGLDTVSTRTPKTGGAAGPTPQGTAPARTGAVPQARKPTPPPSGAQGGAKAAPKPSNAKTGDATLDPDGKHISTNAVGQKWHAGVLTTPIIEAANQLIDDRDVDKIPPKVRELAAALAREKTGWWQGKFNPREENQMDEAKTFLEALRDDIDPVTGKPDKALSVLDSGAWHRFWVGKGMESHKEGQGILGAPAADIENLVRSWRATSRSPSEAAFARKFQQASNVISGLAQLTRGGTRPTDKSIEVIRQELPNIFQATNRKDAIARINNLLKEVDIARRTGTERRGGRGPTPPPTSGGSDIDSDIMNAVKAAKAKPN